MKALDAIYVQSGSKMSKKKATSPAKRLKLVAGLFVVKHALKLRKKIKTIKIKEKGMKEQARVLTDMNFTKRLLILKFMKSVQQ